MSSMDSTLQLLLSFQLKTKDEIASFVGTLSKSQLSTLQKILSQTEKPPVDAEEKKKARIDKIKNLLDKKGLSAIESAFGNSVEVAFSNPSNTNPSSLSFLCLVVCGQYQLIKKSGMDSLMARKTIAVVLKQIKSHFDLNSTDEKFYEYLMDKFKVSNK
jgi:hypothetical protein